jgi:hypothetical protein
LNVAQAVAPAELKIAMKQTRTAYAAGFLTSTQQARQVIGQSRTLGEALDRISEFERMMQAELAGFIQAELATKRIKQDGRDIMTEASADGPFIVLKTPQVPLEATKAIAEAVAQAAQQAPVNAASKKAPIKTAKKAVAAPAQPAKPPVAPAAPQAATAPAKRKYVRRAK